VLSLRPLISGNYVAMSTKGWEAIASGSDSVPRRRIDFEDTEVDVDAVHRELVDAGRLAPVDLGGDDERRWVDCELASFAENRLGDRTHPLALDEATRRSWQERATEEAIWMPSRRREFESCYWLLEDGARAGTIAVARSRLGGALLRVSSLYVFSDRRGRGAARAVLAEVRAALGRRGLGLRLQTSWSWQRAVRLYVRMGMWVHGWKRELDFRWDAAEPPPVIDVGERQASLAVVVDGRRVELARAERRGS